MLYFFIFCLQTFKYPNENRQKQTKSTKLSKTVFKRIPCPLKAPLLKNYFTANISDTEDMERFVVEATVYEHQRKGRVAVEEEEAD